MITTALERTRRPPVLSAVLLALLATVGLATFGATPASATCYTCETGNFGDVQVAAGDWMTANGGGVTAYSNYDIGYVWPALIPPATQPPAASGYVGLPWQCVELTQRLYQAKGWHSGVWQMPDPSNPGHNKGVDYAYQIFDNAALNGLQPHNNDGTYTPVPGDMIVHSPDANSVAGHVAIVDHVSGSSVYVVEQNVATVAQTSAGRATYTIGSDGKLSRPGLSQAIRGILHDPDNTYTNSGSGSGSTYQAAFNSGNLWLYGPNVTSNTGFGMQTGTSPSITTGSDGAFEVAFNSGNLWLYGAITSNTGFGMATGTSPAVAGLTTGGYEAAFQANTGHLWVYGPAGTADTGLGMRAGSSPAITALPNGGYEVAFVANTGHLWSYGTGGSGDAGLGVANNTNPAITSVTGGYEIAFNSGNLWMYGPASTANTGFGMASGTSPAITNTSSGGFEVAFNSGNLWLYGAITSNTGFGMQTGTSPSITTVTSGYEAAFNSGNLWVYGSVVTANTGFGVQSGTSPALTHQ